MFFFSLKKEETFFITAIWKHMMVFLASIKCGPVSVPVVFGMPQKVETLGFLKGCVRTAPLDNT